MADECEGRRTVRDSYIELSRTVNRNAPLCDGTPRCEKGFRPIVETVRRRDERKVYIHGPLLATHREAENWNDF